MEVLVTNFEQDLATKESETGSELQQKPLDVIDERLFDLTLSAGDRGSD